MAATCLLACVKTNPTTDPFQLINIDSLLRTETPGAVPLPVNGRCINGPIYPDSLIYLRPDGGADYIIYPINNPGVGKYYSWPQGLRLDSLTGSINVSASETGLRYKIGFVKKGTTDTCIRTIILAGASYIDSIYVLGNNDTLAYPYFNADPRTSSICDASDDTDYPGIPGRGNGNNKCEFDAADTRGKKGNANQKKVKVRTISGVINLKKTFEEGAFGPNPVNGQAITVPIYYELNDQSGMALQKVDVQLVYYHSRSEIPAALINYIQEKRTDIISLSLILPLGNPRPPIIVITRS